MKFTKISPGETIFMQTYLYKEQIESFKEKKVNITAEFIIKVKIGIDGSPELTEYQGSSVIRIIKKNN